MDGYLNAYCLFCETGKEKRVVHAIHENKWGQAIFAQRVRFIRKNKEWRKVETPLLPGYVFLYTDWKDAPKVDYQSIPHIIRVLTYENGIDRLTGNDLRFADWLWRINGRIDVVKAVQVGDRLEIADRTFKDLHGKIIHVNKRQKKVFVSLNTQSVPVHTWLAYEKVEKTLAGNSEP